jgi:hypothetical protein
MKELIKLIEDKILELREQERLVEIVDSLAYKWFTKKKKEYDHDKNSPFCYIEEDQMILSNAIQSLNQTKKILLDNDLTNLSVKKLKKLQSKYETN